MTNILLLTVPCTKCAVAKFIINEKFQNVKQSK